MEIHFVTETKFTGSGRNNSRESSVQEFPSFQPFQYHSYFPNSPGTHSPVGQIVLWLPREAKRVVGTGHLFRNTEQSFLDWSVLRAALKCGECVICRKGVSFPANGDEILRSHPRWSVDFTRTYGRFVSVTSRPSRRLLRLPLCHTRLATSGTCNQ